MEPAAKNTVLLPTTVVGSYSVPEWLERLKTEYYQRRISAQHLAEIHEVAIKAAVKDQELAGIDIVSDGELRRDNDVDYFLARIPGVQIPQRAKTDYFDYYDAEVTRPLPELPGGRRPAPGSAWLTISGSPASSPTSRSSSPSPARSRCPAGSATRPTPSRASWSARWPAGSTPRRGNWPRPAPTCCRSTSRSWPGTRTRSSSRWRRSTS